MGRDDQQYRNAEPASTDARRARRRLGRGLGLKVVALGLATLLIACWTRLPEDAPPGGSASPSPTAPTLFRGWPKPDFVLLLSGESRGYLQPCGCSKPQYGGYERRYNFLQTLKARGWPVVAADLGDVIQHDGPQKLLKYQVAMEAMKALGYTAVGVGPSEFEAPLFDVIGQYALNAPVPALLAANLQQKKQNFSDCVKDWAVSNARGGGPKVAFVSAVGPSVAKKVQDPTVTFDDNGRVLTAVLQDAKLLAEKPELLVLLYQGSLEEARACARTFPQFRVIVCLSNDEEPPAVPDQVGETLIVQLGHKARYVGVVGVNRTGKPDRPFDLRYQLVSVGPEYETPAGKLATNPILGLMEGYTQEVKQGNYLGKYSQRPHPLQTQFSAAKYVGSAQCKECHEDAYKVWKNSPHSGAYATLEKARKPSLRQYDGECVACHVVGFGYKTGFTDENTTKFLKNVGCESCHGPGSLHVAEAKNGAPLTPALMQLMNPFKGQAKDATVGIIGSCQKCHDIDNDVHFKFAPYWKRIAHPSPPKAGGG